MKKNKIFFTSVVFVFSLFIFSNVNLYSESIIDKSFFNYFSKEDFVKFPNWKNGFDFTKNKVEVLEDEILSFQQTDDYEIKFSYLPRIPVSEDIITENSIYKYQQDMQMRFFKSEDSLISLYKNPLGQTTRVYKEDSFVKQKKYDEKERIFEEKIWKNNSQVFTLLSEKFYKYKSLEDKFYHLVEFFDYQKFIKIIEYNNENNFVAKRETFSFEKVSIEKKSLQEKSLENEEEIIKEKLISTEYYFYDLENRVVEYISEKNNFEVVIKYDYQKNFKNPDEIVFENGIKKSEKIFSSDFDYTNIVYLDENYSVKATYKNSIKVEESIYLDGKKIRTSAGVFYEE